MRPWSRLPGAGILSCTGHSINLSDSSGTIRFPNDSGRYHQVRVRRQSNGLPVIDTSSERPMYWIPRLVHDTLGHVSSDRLLTAFNNGWITSKRPLGNLKAELKTLADNCVTCKIGQSRQSNQDRRGRRIATFNCLIKYWVRCG